MTDKKITQHAAFYNEFSRKGKVYYGIGSVFLAAALIYWAVDIFFFFTEFHTKGLLDLLLAPVFKFVANPFLWLSIIFFKLSQRHRQPEDDNKHASSQPV
jgi:hypothetical protein